LLVAMPAAANTFPCFEETALQSARVHDLRMMLMVASLKCRFSYPETLREYGDLLDARSDDFNLHGEEVRGTLVARYGSVQGDAAYHNYNTRLANYYSQLQPSTELCGEVTTFMRLAQRADVAELETIGRLATNRAIEQCLVVQTMPAPAVAHEELIVRYPQAQVEDAPEMVDGIETYSTPGTGPDTRPEPLERVAVAPAASLQVAAAAPAPAPDPVKVAKADEDARIDQAIVALNAAAEALRALKTGTK
jgi:hypothetical protein